MPTIYKNKMLYIKYIIIITKIIIILVKMFFSRRCTGLENDRVAEGS